MGCAGSTNCFWWLNSVEQTNSHYLPHPKWHLTKRKYCVDILYVFVVVVVPKKTTKTKGKKKFKLSTTYWTESSCICGTDKVPFFSILLFFFFSKELKILWTLVQYTERMSAILHSYFNSVRKLSCSRHTFRVQLILALHSSVSDWESEETILTSMRTFVPSKYMCIFFFSTIDSLTLKTWINLFDLECYSTRYFYVEYCLNTLEYYISKM